MHEEKTNNHSLARVGMCLCLLGVVTGLAVMALSGTAMLPRHPLVLVGVVLGSGLLLVVAGVLALHSFAPRGSPVVFHPTEVDTLSFAPTPLARNVRPVLRRVK